MPLLPFTHINPLRRHQKNACFDFLTGATISMNVMNQQLLFRQQTIPLTVHRRFPKTHQCYEGKYAQFFTKNACAEHTIDYKFQLIYKDESMGAVNHRLCCILRAEIQIVYCANCSVIIQRQWAKVLSSCTSNYISAKTIKCFKVTKSTSMATIFLTVQYTLQRHDLAQTAIVKCMFGKRCLSLFHWSEQFKKFKLT